MDAVITNITEFRNKKDGATNIDYFSSWSDKRLTTRRTLLQYIAAGHLDLVDPSEPMVRMVFPNGYNPEGDPGDNLAAVDAECERRGVFVKSE